MNCHSRIAACFVTLFLVPFIATAESDCSKSGYIPPRAIDDYVSAEKVGVAVPIAVLANDVGATNAKLSVVRFSLSGTPKGTVTQAGNELRYTPTVSPLSDDTFSYTIRDDTGSNLESTATVWIRRPSTGARIELVRPCVNGHCTFVAIPDDPVGIRHFAWVWGDVQNQPPQILPDTVQHQYPVNGSYTVSVTIHYYSGKTATASLGVTIQYRERAEWTVVSDGLLAAVTQIRPWSAEGLEFPPGTTVEVNWSRNAADCDAGCGPLTYQRGPTGILSDSSSIGVGECRWSECSVSGRYNRPGTYAAALRFVRPPASCPPPNPPSACVLEHAFPITVQNNAPDIDKLQLTRASDVWPKERRYTVNYHLRDEHDDKPLDLTWDFGDGTTATGHVSDHAFSKPGTYVVALKARDSAGVDGTRTAEIDVVNLPPQPRMRLDCALSQCRFYGDASFDDSGDNTIQQYDWNFGDGTSQTGMNVEKTYTSAGCYDTRLTITDDLGLTAQMPQRISVGPPVFAQAGGVTVDVHSGSFPAQHFQDTYLTTNGNLNGILEPNERVVIEPNWAMPPTEALIKTRTGSNWSTMDTGYVVTNWDSFATYRSTGNVSDCWSNGDCFAIEVKLGSDANCAGGCKRDPNVTHRDISFGETYLGSSQSPNPNGTKIHLGETFQDVPTNYWAYPEIESIAHASVTGGCAQWAFCPTSALTRAQIAVWIFAANYPGQDPPACVAPGPFADVPCSHWASRYIAKIKADGITSGVDGVNYAPESTLTRGELATFVVKARESLIRPGYQPPACTPDFYDVPCPTHWASAWISEAKRRGYSFGCTANEFCPDLPADRAQAAVMFTRAYRLALNASACPSSAVKYDVVPGYQTPPPIQALTFSPSPAITGSTTTGTIRLSYPPTAAVQIPLTSDKPAVAAVPASVTVSAGQLTGTFTVTAGSVAVRTTATITATYQNTQKTATLDVCLPPPAISAQPAARTINSGSSTTLSVTATGSGTLSYQWYEGASGTTTTPAGTGNPFTTPVLSATKQYWVRVSNGCGNADSTAATVTVCALPGITTHPASQTIASGATATLSVTASGSAPLSYQWFEGASSITTAPVGTNSPTYTTPALTANKQYWVRVTSTCNGTAVVNSNAATITVSSQISRRQIAQNNASNTTSITATWPQPTQAGTLLVAILSTTSPSGSFGAFAPPAGWQLARSHEGSNVKTSIYYYANNPGGRTAETFTNSAARTHILQLAEYIGANSTAPLDKTAVAAGAVTDSGFLSSGTTATLSQSKELLVTAMTIYAPATFSRPSNGFVEVQERSADSLVTTVMHEQIVSFASQYTHTAMASADGSWIGLIVSFKAANTSAFLEQPPTNLYAAVETNEPAHGALR